MSRRVMRQLLARIDDLETELENVRADRRRFIAALFWKEKMCETRPTDS